MNGVCDARGLNGAARTRRAVQHLHVPRTWRKNTTAGPSRGLYRFGRKAPPAGHECTKRLADRLAYRPLGHHRAGVRSFASEGPAHLLQDCANARITRGGTTVSPTGKKGRKPARGKDLSADTKGPPPRHTYGSSGGSKLGSHQSRVQDGAPRLRGWDQRRRHHQVAHGG